MLDTIRYAERKFLSLHEGLQQAPTYVHFHAEEEAMNRTEDWGPLESAVACLNVTYATTAVSIPPSPSLAPQCRWLPIRLDR